jgi:hypothetical protein
MRYIRRLIRSSESCPSRLGNLVDMRCDQPYDTATTRLSGRRGARMRATILTSCTVDTALQAPADNLRHRRGAGRPFAPLWTHARGQQP